ncbi:hypothetical protein [Aurantiacibacter gangjinensis]|uniref:hypothetical protein n=1 Tax=Aurantiacibacter gangjinensis TaxID=502682 RepID=UPI00069BD737|nr:hypothetical protein [Aurantiacibacter gangjinensis]APE26941.1 hypothetical protein BMF35_a0112 [Aurantiacibacter gangjinensis]
MSDQSSIKGLWTGSFQYFSSPDAGDHPFKAKIFERDGVLSGMVIEEHEMALQSVRAEIKGSREGRRITFTKTYLESSEIYKSAVEYAGEIAADGDTITGTWKLPHDGGPFTMTRDASTEI